MRIKILSALLMMAYIIGAFGQTLDRAKLDQFFERLAEKKQAMGSLAIVKDGKVLCSRAIGYSQGGGERVFTKEK